MQKSLITTRDYLSWSQLLCWEKTEIQLKNYYDPTQTDYYKRYFLGEYFTNKEMEFGRKIADGLEKRKTKDFAVEWCRTWLPKPDRREVKMTATIEGIKLLGQLDGLTYHLKTPIMVDEYKTCKVEGGRHIAGKGEWTQKKADEHGQLTMYDMMIWTKTKKIPANRLSMIPTIETEDGQIQLTGEPPRIFLTTRTEKDFAILFKRLEKARKGIDEFCKII